MPRPITRKLLTSNALAAVTLTGIAASAQAATVEYRNDNALTINNNNGVNGQVTVIPVPAGRTPVQTLELPGVKPFWSSGGTDLEMFLVGPNGDQMHVMITGCATMGNTTNFTITDNATAFAESSIAFCNNELVGGKGKPKDNDGKTFASFFGGKASGGNWTLHVRDIGVQAGGGTFSGWGLRITHAPLVPTIVAKKQPLGKSLRFMATCNADCALTTGGDTKAKTEQLNQGNTEALKAKLKAKARDRLEEKGKAKLKVTVDDGYGDVVTETVKVKLKR